MASPKRGNPVAIVEVGDLDLILSLLDMLCANGKDFRAVERTRFFSGRGRLEDLIAAHDRLCDGCDRDLKWGER